MESNISWRLPLNSHCSRAASRQSPVLAAYIGLYRDLGGRGLDPTHLSRNADGTFQRRAVPAASLRCGCMGGGQQVEERSVKVRGVTNRVIWQNKMA